MKVAYNACFGGFGLSPLALTKYAERKGITLYWYSCEGFGDKSVHTRSDVIPEEDSFRYTAFNQDLGETFTEHPKDAYYSMYTVSEEGNRSDPDLIAVIEELGDEVNTRYSNLQIEEIPDGADYEIDEYDGNESVVPPRREWSDYE